MSNIWWFQLPKCEDLLFFFLVHSYIIHVNWIFGAFWRSRLGFWKTVTFWPFINQALHQLIKKRTGTFIQTCNWWLVAALTLMRSDTDQIISGWMTSFSLEKTKCLNYLCCSEKHDVSNVVTWVRYGSDLWLEKLENWLTKCSFLSLYFIYV